MYMLLYAIYDTRAELEVIILLYHSGTCVGSAGRRSPAGRSGHVISPRSPWTRANTALLYGIWSASYPGKYTLSPLQLSHIRLNK